MSAPHIYFYRSSTTEVLNAKFAAIFPTWPTIVATILAVIILFLILTKLFYNPVKKMVAERRRFIQSNIDSAIQQNEVAASDRLQASQEIVEAQVIASNIVSEAKIRAEKIMKDNITSAKDEANRIVQSAHKEAEREKELFETQAKEEMVSLALEAAKHVIAKEVNVAANRKLVRDFIKAKYSGKDHHDS